MTGHIAAAIAVLLICFLASAGIAILRLIEWLAMLAGKRRDEYEKAVTEALIVAGHPAATAERLFTEEDNAWLEQEGISR